MTNRVIKNIPGKNLFLTLLLCVITSVVFLPVNDLRSINLKEHTKDTGVIEVPRVASEYSGIGLARNATEFGKGNFQNFNLNISNDDNASIIVPHDWYAKEITSNVSKINEYNTLLLNSTFNTEEDSDGWSGTTDKVENVTFGWYDAPTGSNDSIFIRFNETSGDGWEDVISYWTYKFDLQREYIPFENWEVTYNYRIIYNYTDWLPGTGGSSHYINVSVNGITQLFSQGRLSTLLGFNNTWLQGGAIFQAEQFGFTLPGTISLGFGIDFGNSGNDPLGWMEIYYDNITLKISTIPKPSQINLIIKDVTNDITINFNDINGYGLGTVNIMNNWEGDIGGKTHNFSFSSNSTGELIIDTEFFVKAISLEKTTTQLGDDGCEFFVKNDTVVAWTTYYSINVPGSYSDNYYFNISKPKNWNITQLIDPYGNDKINDVDETRGYGNSSLMVPESIITNGLWKIIAEAPNYVKEVNVYRKIPLGWELNSSFQNFDKLKINGSIRTAEIPNPGFTNVSFSIFYPNGTLWYQKGNILIDDDGNFSLPIIIIGPNNASAGLYNVHIHWSNYNVNMSQVGSTILNFSVSHNTILKRENSYSNIKIPIFSGDTVLIKVNYTDVDINKEIVGALVNYSVDNATVITGPMVYQGGGIYFAEIQTTGLQPGIYNITISATKYYYETKNELKLFELEMQLYTTLERYESPTFVEFNDNATVNFRYKDSYGIGITGAIIKVSINQEYILSIDDIGEGNYSIKFDTEVFSTLGRQIITFNFSSTGYETQIDVFQFQLISQDVDIRVFINTIEISKNELLPQYFNDHLNITARIFASKENEYLSGGITALVSENYEDFLTESSPTYFESSITLSLSNFSGGVNYVDIIFQKQNYTTTIFAFQVQIEQIHIDVETIDFNNSIEVLAGEKVALEVKLTESGTDKYFENATIIFNWKYGVGNFSYIGNGIYESELIIPKDIGGSQLITLIISSDSLIYETTDFSFFLDIIEVPQPNILFGVVVTILLITISILGSLSLRSYVYLPYKRRKILDLIRKTQRYKDIDNIETYVVSDKNSGLPFYIETYFSLEKTKRDLLSGFIYAITTVSTELLGNDDLKQRNNFKKSMSAVKSIELDFKQFHFLISDYKDLRLVFILKNKASERFKSQTTNLLLALDLQLANKIETWKGDLAIFEDLIPPIIKGYFELQYKDYFKLNSLKLKSITSKEREFKKMENRVLNVIESFTQNKEEFYLKEIIETVGEKNKNLVIAAIESLIEKKHIVLSKEDIILTK